MNRRSLMLSVAAGVLATLAFVTPSQAGSSLITTTLDWSIAGPNGPTATEVLIDYTAIDPISSLTVKSTTFAGLTLSEPAANTVAVKFDRTDTGTVTFTFLTGVDPTTIGADYSGLGGTLAHTPVTDLTVHIAVSYAAVPEPASMALLGIGMTGFLAFRRFFKKTSVA